MKRDTLFIETPLLKVGYEQKGPASAFPVLLLHGWPDDVRTWDGVVTRLNEAGFRTITPYLRGFGPTRFLNESTMRSGQLSALGSDVIELTRALGLDRFALVGHDWGARAAYIVGSEHGDRVARLITISVGYGTNTPDQTLPIAQVRNYWYHWYFSLSRGVDLVERSRRELARFMWQTWSPTWQHGAAEFDATAASFDNPDWAKVTIHSYRHRWGHADGDPRYNEIERRLSALPTINVPTLVLHGGADACNDPVTSADKEKYFTNRYRRQIFPDLGHFPQREDPDAVAAEIIAWLRC